MANSNKKRTYSVRFLLLTKNSSELYNPQKIVNDEIIFVRG